MLVIRVVQRGIGIFSTLILARLLTPEDFGVVAIIAIVIQFFDIVSTTGSEEYIIQKDVLTQEDLDTAWTLNILLKVILWVVLFTAAPYIADFYENPELTSALRVISFALIINGFLSPGLIVLKKNLNYSPILKLSIIQKLLSFSVVMAITFYEPSFWALIFGDLMSAAAYVGGSYIISTYRPSVSLKKFREQINFSQWIFYKSVFGFARSQIDTILVSKFFDVSEVGKFHVVKSLTAMPALDIISPAVDPLLSAFSKNKTDLEDLAYKIRFSLCVIVLLVLPLCAYIAVFPEPIINSFLGPQWVSAYQMMSFLSILLFTISISHIFESTCIALGKVKHLFIYNVLSMFLLLLCLLAFSSVSIDLFVLARSIAGLLTSLAFLFYISLLVNINIKRVLYLCLPMFASVGLSVFITKAMWPLFTDISFMQLCISTAALFTTYIVAMVFVYRIFMYRFKEYEHAKSILVSLINQKLAKP